jgi:hypothetical protein
MDKARAGIIANPAAFEVQGGASQLLQSHPRDTDVNGLTLQMKAVPGNMMTFPAQQAVVLGRPVSRNDVKLVASSQFFINGIKIFDDPDVHVGNFPREMAAKNPIKGIDGVGAVIAGWIAVIDGKPFL